MTTGADTDQDRINEPAPPWWPGRGGSVPIRKGRYARRLAMNSFSCGACLFAGLWHAKVGQPMFAVPLLAFSALNALCAWANYQLRFKHA